MLPFKHKLHFVDNVLLLHKARITFLQCQCMCTNKYGRVQIEDIYVKKVNCKHIYKHVYMRESGWARWDKKGRMEDTRYSANWTDC